MIKLINIIVLINLLGKYKVAKAEMNAMRVVNSQ